MKMIIIKVFNMGKLFVILGIVVGLVPLHIKADNQMVNVYSFRQAELINPLLKEFTAQTGIKVNVVSGKANVLMQRLIDDGKNSRVDILLTTDVARLEQAKKLNLIQPVVSQLLQSNVPSQLRDPEHFWVGLSIRARAIFYAKSRVNPANISSYQNLIEPKWKGKICSRKGEHFYNRSMIASFIYNYGEKWTNNWTNLFVNNLAMRPLGGDRDQLPKLVMGKCDVAIANSYYYGMLSSSNKAQDRQVYAQVGIIFPSNDGIGTHINISGVALTSAAKNKSNAIKFIEFLTTKRAQQYYAEFNHEYPIRSDMAPGQLLTSWGKLLADKNAVLQLPKYHELAKEIIRKNHW